MVFAIRIAAVIWSICTFIHLQQRCSVCKYFRCGRAKIHILNHHEASFGRSLVSARAICNLKFSLECSVVAQWTLSSDEIAPFINVESFFFFLYSKLFCGAARTHLINNNLIYGLLFTFYNNHDNDLFFFFNFLFTRNVISFYGIYRARWYRNLTNVLLVSEESTHSLALTYSRNGWLINWCAKTTFDMLRLSGLGFTWYAFVVLVRYNALGLVC